VIGVSVNTIDENGSTTLSGSFTDPGTLDTHDVTINWGDGNTQTVNLAAGVTTYSVPHQYLQDGTYPIGVSVADSGGGSSASVSKQATGNNGAPSGVVIGLTVNTIDENGSNTPGGRFTEPRTLDTHDATIHRGRRKTQTA